MSPGMISGKIVGKKKKYVGGVLTDEEPETTASPYLGYQKEQESIKKAAPPIETETETTKPNKPPHVNINSDGSVEETIGDTTTHYSYERWQERLRSYQEAHGYSNSYNNQPSIPNAQKTYNPTIQEAEQRQALIDNPEMSQEEQAKIRSEISSNEAPQDYADPLANQQGALEPYLKAGTGIAAGVGGGIAASAGMAALAMKGGAIGTAITPGVGTAVGIGAGLIAGAAAALGKMAINARQDVTNANKLYLQSKSNMGIIVNRLNAGKYSSRAQARMDFQTAKQDILTAERHLKDSNSNVNKYISGGYDEMTRLQTWKQFNLGFAEEDFIKAYIKPNPNAQAAYYLEADEVAPTE